MPSGVRGWPLWGTPPPARYWFPILPPYPNHPTPPQVMYKAEYDWETSLLNCRIEHKTTDRCQVTMVEIWTSTVNTFSLLFHQACFFCIKFHKIGLMMTARLMFRWRKICSLHFQVKSGFARCRLLLAWLLLSLFNCLVGFRPWLSLLALRLFWALALATRESRVGKFGISLSYLRS